MYTYIYIYICISRLKAGGVLWIVAQETPNLSLGYICRPALYEREIREREREREIPHCLAGGKPPQN